MLRPEDFDENTSAWWLDAGPATALPPLAGDTTCDVVIIGGGFTGLSTAWHLSQRVPDKRIIVLEAKRLANGASGRNGGQMLHHIYGLDPNDLEVVRRVYDLTDQTIQWITGTVRERNLPVDVGLDGNLELCTRQSSADHVQRRVEILRGIGVDVSWIPPERLGERATLQGARGALLDPRSGHLNGVQWVRALADMCRERGVHIHEGTPALAITEGRTVEVQTAGGTIRAGAVVLATHCWTHHLGYFKRTYFPLFSHMVATPRMTDEARRAAGWADLAGFSDDLDRLAYGTRTGTGRLLLGGGSNASYDYRYGWRTAWTGPRDRGVAAVRDRLNGYLPGLQGVSTDLSWTGTLGITLNRRCAIGTRGEHGNVLYAFGYSGHGITAANLAGRILADLYVGDREPYRGLPFIDYEPVCLPPEPLQWLGYQAVTRLTGHSPRRTHA